MLTAAAAMAAFGLGLAGSLHCVGMCGPLVLALPKRQGASTGSHLYGRVLYNLGRTTTYACMGLFAGWLGRVIQLAGVQQAVSIGLGVVLLLTVFLTTRQLPAWMVRTFYKPIQTLLGRIMKNGSPLGLYQVGLVNGLLPCGLVYAALAAASLQGTPLSAVLYMTLFGLGTAPLLFALSLGGLGIQSPRLRPVLNRLIPVLTCVVASLLILRGMALGIPYLSPDLVGGASCCPH